MNLNLNSFIYISWTLYPVQNHHHQLRYMVGKVKQNKIETNRAFCRAWKELHEDGEEDDWEYQPSCKKKPFHIKTFRFHFICSKKCKSRWKGILRLIN